MKRLNSFAVFALAIVFLSACGGGGGGSSSTPTTPPSGGTGGGTGGGAGGGSGGGSSVTGGLIPGGASVSTGSATSGVILGVAEGGTGASFDVGDIQDFGSVILNDVTVNTDNATFIVEGATGAQSDLKQGQQVLVIADSSGTSADGVHYRSNVKGPVTEVTVVDAELGIATLTVLGQSVITDAATTFANVNLVDIATGNLLEVSGTLNDSGAIQASYIELKATLTEYKVTGTTSNTNATNFSINGLDVDYSSASLQDFAGAVADNDVVEVKAAPGSFLAPDQLEASRVELLPTLSVGANVPASIEGYIDRFASPSDFDIQTAPVSTDANTNFINGTAASLQANSKVQAEGTFDASGVLLADNITIQSTDAIRAEGHVEAIDIGAETLTVLGVNFRVRDFTRFEDDSAANQNPFSLSDIGIGDEMEIRGYLDGAQVVATRVEREDPADRARLRGPVTAEDAATGTVAILSISLSGQSGVTEYQDENDATITEAAFFNAIQIGTVIRADWDVFVDTNQPVDEFSIED